MDVKLSKQYVFNTKEGTQLQKSDLNYIYILHVLFKTKPYWR